MVSASSACTIISDPQEAVSASAASSSSGVSGGNSSTPECSRKPLKPNTPSSCSERISGRFPGTAPAQKPTSTKAFRSAKSCLYSRAGEFTVEGTEFRGMSRMVVTPPAAAALVALAKPSHSVRPGSLTCTCASTRPGRRVSSGASSTTSSPSSPAPRGAMAAILPSRMPTSRGAKPSSPKTRSPRSTRSKRVPSAVTSPAPAPAAAAGRGAEDAAGPCVRRCSAMRRRTRSGSFTSTPVGLAAAVSSSRSSLVIITSSCWWDRSGGSMGGAFGTHPPRSRSRRGPSSARGPAAP